MLHISNTPAHENNVLIALVTKSKANAILSRVAISPEHLTARRQIALIVCASNPSLHLYSFAFCAIFMFLASAGFFLNYYFSVDPDLGLN